MTSDSSASMKPLWLAALVMVLCGVFYVMEHTFEISTREAHAQAADEMEGMAEGGNTARRAVVLAMAGLGTLGLLISRGANWRPVGPGAVLLVSFVALATASVAWSEEPSLTARRVFVLVAGFVAALGISRQFSLRDFCWAALSATLFFALLGIAAELSLGTFRPWQGDYRFGGTVHPNTQGGFLATMCLAAWCLSRRESSTTWLLRGICLFGLVLIVLTKSRTSLAATLVALTVVTLAQASPAAWVKMLLGGAWLAGLAALVLLLWPGGAEDSVVDLALLGREEQSESLTGRLPLWEELSRHVAQRPLLGYGYDSFWTAEAIAAVSREMEWGIREAHNAYIEMTLGVGIIGLALLLAAVLVNAGTAAAAGDTLDPAARAFLLGLVAFGLLNACLESAMARPVFVPFMGACLFCRLSFFEPSRVRAAASATVEPEPALAT